MGSHRAIRCAHPAFFVIFIVIGTNRRRCSRRGAAALGSRVLCAPGWAVKSFLEVCGIHAPNAVGVASTVALWWLLFAALGLAWERRRRGSAT
jgi:hypothetical protein